MGINGKTEKAVRPWAIMFMVMAANFQVEGRDDIPACVLKMQTSIKQLDLIMSMINQLPHAASAGSVSAKVAVSMYPLRSRDEWPL